MIVRPSPGWDARKFATRYGLNPLRDFYVNGDGNLVIVPTLPDNPPIFELADPLGPTRDERIDSATTLDELKTVLKAIL